MRYAVSVFLGVHAIAHLVGFAVPWRLLTASELPFKTTVLAGRVDIGEAGIRTLGVFWLLTAIVMVATAAGLAMQARWATALVFPVIGASLILCLLDLPAARIGLAINVVLLLFFLLHPSSGIGAMRWQRAGADLRMRLGAARDGTTGTVTLAGTEGLPEPVRRYFRHVLTDGQSMAHRVSFTQQGQFRMGAQEDSWRPMQATQRFSIGEPGFIWDAKIDAYPLAPVLVRDSYVQGAAGMVASVLGLLTVMNAPASSDLNAGALQRYLAEAVWFPVALLPASGVRWEAIDGQLARAFLADRGTTVSLDFHFNDSDEIDRIFTPSRLREVNGQYVPTPWLVECRDYRRLHGMLVPTDCEVSWELEAGLMTYWKGTISSGP